MAWRAFILAALGLGLAAQAEARTWRVEPGPDAQQQLQSALISAQAGDEVRLARGRYDLRAGLRLSVNGVTLRGAGQDRTTLSFTGQSDDGDGVAVAANNVTLQDFAVEDARGDAVTARNCDTVSFIGVRAEWTRGLNAQNGKHGFRTDNCANVLIDSAIARGATLAGLAVSQGRTVVIRKSTAEANGAGFIVENSFNVDLHDSFARNNADGIVVIDRPGLAQSGGHDIRIFKNEITTNNTPSVAADGDPTAAAPANTGVVVIATRNVHVFDNEISDNGAVNVFIAAYRGAVSDAHFDPLPRDVVVRDNRLGRAGFAPVGDLAAVAQSGVTLPDVLWDGATTYSAGGTPHTEIVRLSIMNNSAAHGDGAPTFLSLGISIAGVDWSEAAPEITLLNVGRIPEPPEVRLPQD